MRLVFELMEDGSIKVNRGKAVVDLETALAMIEALVGEAHAHFQIIRESLGTTFEVR